MRPLGASGRAKTFYRLARQNLLARSAATSASGSKSACSRHRLAGEGRRPTAPHTFGGVRRVAPWPCACVCAVHMGGGQRPAGRRFSAFQFRKLSHAFLDNLRRSPLAIIGFLARHVNDRHGGAARQRGAPQCARHETAHRRRRQRPLSLRRAGRPRHEPHEHHAFD